MLNWTITQTENHNIHTTSLATTTKASTQQTLGRVIDKAVSLLPHNIQHNSLYLLFEWDSNSNTLQVVVTDSTKTHDAPDRVRCIFSSLNSEPHRENTLSETERNVINIAALKYWLHDYLTTCTGFFSYSLVAIFHSSTRDQTELL